MGDQGSGHAAMICVWDDDEAEDDPVPPMLSPGERRAFSEACLFRQRPDVG